MATHRTYHNRYVVLCEGDKIDISHESAEDMWESLGWHVDWEMHDRDGTFLDDGTISHPACTIEQLDTLTDAQILELRCPRDEGGNEEREAWLSAIVYARGALDDMRSIESSLIAATENYEQGDIDGVLEHLRAAEREESDYGDCPATRALADALLDDYEVTDDGTDAEAIDAAR